jgi:hypothetical protein
MIPAHQTDSISWIAATRARDDVLHEFRPRSVCPRLGQTCELYLGRFCDRLIFCHKRAFGHEVREFAGTDPGTFFARNKYRGSCGTFGGYFGCGWSFYEKFVITSGVSKIIGKINASGSGPILGIHQYTTRNGYSGNVNIQSLGGVFSSGGDFSEIFHGM